LVKDMERVAPTYRRPIIFQILYAPQINKTLETIIEDDDRMGIA